MNQRKRGRSLSADGIAAVRNELSTRGWDRGLYKDTARLSASTITRMLAGKRVDLSSLTDALGVLDLEVDAHTCKITSPEHSPQRPILDVAIVPSHDTVFSFYMNATFAELKRPQIKCVLTALKEQLMDSEVIFHGDDNRLTVSGVFSPENKKAIEATLRHLEVLFTSYTLTGDISCMSNEQPLLTVSAH